jgi:small neutral amino acid transporter SnatA (MarC family)
MIFVLVLAALFGAKILQKLSIQIRAYISPKVLLTILALGTLMNSLSLKGKIKTF